MVFTNMRCYSQTIPKRFVIPKLRSTSKRPIHYSTPRFNLGSSKNTTTTTTTPKSKNSRFNFKHPLVYPIALIFLFGSQIINIMNIKKEQAELDSRYGQKISILEKSIQRLESGEAVDVEKELKRINKVFLNHELLKKKDYKGLEKLNDEDDEEEEAEESDRRLNESLSQLFRESVADTDIKVHSGDNINSISVQQQQQQQWQETIQQEHQQHQQSDDIERIVVKDVPGAMEDVAATRKVTKFL